MVIRTELEISLAEGLSVPYLIQARHGSFVAIHGLDDLAHLAIGTPHASVGGGHAQVIPVLDSFGQPLLEPP